MKTRAHPIVLADGFADAAADGTKTQHRVPVDASNSYVDGHVVTTAMFAELVLTRGGVCVDPGPSPAGNSGPYIHVPNRDGDRMHRVYPRRTRGDLVYVKETWNRHGGLCSYRADGDWIADYRTGSAEHFAACKARGVEPKWQSASKMRRDDARTILQITSVWPEAVAAVDEMDARAEGYPCTLHTGAEYAGKDCGCYVGNPRLLIAWRHRYGAEAVDGWCWRYDWKLVKEVP